MNYKKLLALIILAFGFQSYAQEKKVIYFSDILEEALFSGKDTLLIENVTVLMEFSDEEKIFKGYPYGFDLDAFIEKYSDRKLKIDSAGRLIISSVLAFSNISSKSVIRLENLSFKKPFHFTGIPRILWIESCLFNGHYIQSSNNGGYREDKSPLNSRTFIFQDNIVLNSISFFEKNEPNIISVENAAEVLIDYNYFKNESSIEEDSIQYLISLYDVRSITISDNTFNLADVNLMFSNIENIVLDQNNFFGWVNVFGNASGDYWINEEGILEWDNYVSSKIYNFDMVKNNFKGLGLSLSNFKFIETTNFINNDFNNYQFKKLDFGGNLNFDFRQLVDVNISLGNKYLDSSYHAITDHELSQYDPFMELIQFYTLLYRNDKERGNIESANDAYYELSELYTRKYAYMQRKEPNLNNWFKWRLNQLLGYYIGYGTDPAKALVISFYIIIFFSVFYFFFPSEWDVSSKSKILKNMKLTINKNEPKTFQTLIKAVALLFLSFLNAFTLSMNSFVTLGFGNIPTKGLARYVCIVQGFLGWFLLSLFSVALINQVIF